MRMEETQGNQRQVGSPLAHTCGTRKTTERSAGRRVRSMGPSGFVDDGVSVHQLIRKMRGASIDGRRTGTSIRPVKHDGLERLLRKLHHLPCSREDIVSPP